MAAASADRAKTYTNEANGNEYRFSKTKESLLGRGSFASVYKAEVVRDPSGTLPKTVALKVASRHSNKDVWQRIVDQGDQEQRLSARLGANPNVVRVYDHFLIKKDTSIYDVLVMELIGGPNLKTVVEKLKLSEGRFPIEETVVAKLMGQIAQGILALHEKDFIHRDLKPENLILSSPDISREGLMRAEAKIIDLGLGRTLEGKDLAKTMLGSPQYMAPEVYFQSGHNNGADMWGFGMIIYELLVGNIPWPGHRAPLPFFQDIQRRPVDYSKVSASAKSLLEGLLIIDHAKRLSISDVIRHPFFSSHMPEATISRVISNPPLLNSRGLPTAGLGTLLSPMVEEDDFEVVEQARSGSDMRDSFETVMVDHKSGGKGSDGPEAIVRMGAVECANLLVRRRHELHLAKFRLVRLGEDAKLRQLADILTLDSLAAFVSTVREEPVQRLCDLLVFLLRQHTARPISPQTAQSIYNDILKPAASQMLTESLRWQCVVRVHELTLNSSLPFILDVLSPAKIVESMGESLDDLAEVFANLLVPPQVEPLVANEVAKFLIRERDRLASLPPRSLGGTLQAAAAAAEAAYAGGTMGVTSYVSGGGGGGVNPLAGVSGIAAALAAGGVGESGIGAAIERRGEPKDVHACLTEVVALADDLVDGSSPEVSLQLYLLVLKTLAGYCNTGHLAGSAEIDDDVVAELFLRALQRAERVKVRLTEMGRTHLLRQQTAAAIIYDECAKVGQETATMETFELLSADEAHQRFAKVMRLLLSLLWVASGNDRRYLAEYIQPLMQHLDRTHHDQQTVSLAERCLAALC